MTRAEMRRWFVLWGGFLGWPFLVVGILWIVEDRSGSVNLSTFLKNVSITLAGYAVGSIVPLVHGDELFQNKFGTVTRDERLIIIKFTDDDRSKLEFAKMIVMFCLFLGLVVWIENIALTEASGWWRLFAYVYFFLTGMLQVYIKNSGRPRPVPPTE